MKEGKVTDEDAKNIIRDIADNPEGAKELLEILGIERVDGEVHERTDFIDGAPMSGSILRKLPNSKDVTYESFLAALDKTSLTFQQRDLMAQHCLIDKGKSVLFKGPRISAKFQSVNFLGIKACWGELEIYCKWN